MVKDLKYTTQEQVYAYWPINKVKVDDNINLTTPITQAMVNGLGSNQKGIYTLERLLFSYTWTDVTTHSNILNYISAIAKENVIAAKHLKTTWEDTYKTKFIESTVEGEGGEVHAFMTECRVLNELFPKRLQARYNCKKIISTETGKISKKLAVEKFYSVGSYYNNFKHKLDLHGIGGSFPYISKNEIGFVSSAYGMPYPIAAYHEFKSVLSKVCENDKRRISYMKVGNRGRTIASISKAKKDYLDKCSSIKAL